MHVSALSPGPLPAVDTKLKVASKQWIGGYKPLVLKA